MSVLHDPIAAKICTKHVLFEVDTLWSLYKALFQGTSLGTALLRMSSKKVAPAGLKHQECEHGRGEKKASIQYIPECDPIQEALDLNPESRTLTNGSEPRVTVWSRHGTNKQFVLHINNAYSTCKMGLLSAYEVAKKAYDSTKWAEGCANCTGWCSH